MQILHTDTKTLHAKSVSYTDLSLGPGDGSLGAYTLQTLGKRLQATYHLADDDRLPVRLTELVERLARREPSEG